MVEACNRNLVTSAESLDRLVHAVAWDCGRGFRLWSSRVDGP